MFGPVRFPSAANFLRWIELLLGRRSAPTAKHSNTDQMYFARGGVSRSSGLQCWRGHSLLFMLPVLIPTSEARQTRD
jgi:hypothetical protein